MKSAHLFLMTLSSCLLFACGSSGNSHSTKNDVQSAISWPHLNNGDQFRLKGITSNGVAVDVTFIIHILDTNTQEYTNGEVTVTYASVDQEVVTNYSNPGTITYTPKRNTNTANLQLNVASQGGASFIETRRGTGATLTWDPGLVTGTISFNGFGIVAGETFTSSNDGAFQKVQFEYKRATPDANPAPTVTP